MNSAVHLRMTLLMTAIVLMVGLTLWAVQVSWRRITQLKGKLTSAHLASFRLAKDFQQRLFRLEDLLRKCQGASGESPS